MKKREERIAFSIGICEPVIISTIPLQILVSFKVSAVNCKSGKLSIEHHVSFLALPWMNTLIDGVKSSKMTL